MGNSEELISMFSDITSISSGTPCGSSVSGASGPPGFAATAITGHSLNLANKKNTATFISLLDLMLTKHIEKWKKIGPGWAVWVSASGDGLTVCGERHRRQVERPVTGWGLTTVKLHSISLLGLGLGAITHLVFSSVLWSLLVIFSMAVCLLSAGSRSVLFRTTTMRGQASSPISRHSAVCVWTPFTTSTTSIIRSMIWAPAGETRFRQQRRLCQLLRQLENGYVNVWYFGGMIWLCITTTQWKNKNKTADWGEHEANDKEILTGRDRGAQK